MNKPVDFVIIDGETLDDKSWKAVVLSISMIGGYWEDIENDNIDALLSRSETVYFKVKPQYGYGRTDSQKTIDWWKKQPKEATDVFKNADKVDLSMFPDIFTNFIFKLPISDKYTKIFARGTDFDPVIIHSIYDYFDKPVPYKPFNLRDVRTALDVTVGDTYIKDFNDYCQKKYGLVKHNSLHDCMRDIIQVYYGLAKDKDDLSTLYESVGMTYRG